MIAEGPRVLLVDDEEVFRLSTTALLQREGYRCDSAGDSEEASRLLSNPYDVMVSDIRMSGNMQMEFLREVRQRYPDLPILVVTGYPSLETALISLRLSFVEYLLKPIDWPKMRHAIVQAVERGRRLRAFWKGSDEVVGPNGNPVPMEHALAAPDTATSEHGLNWPLKQYLAQCVAQMNVLSSNVQQTLAGIRMEMPHAPSDVCEFMQCPRQGAYKEALLDTVEVLERTKHAFKSKELGELRRRLEVLLKESGK
jgi:CheY-like chemotaxis protein